MNPVDENNDWNKEAPLLGGLSRKELHKAPDGYFDNLAERVLQQMNEAPVLFSLEKKELVEVPEGYFESVETKIKNITGKKEAPVVSIRARVLRWTAAAACICIIAVAAFMFMGHEKVNGAIAALPEIDTENDAANYLVDELHEDDLIAYMSEEEMENESNEVVDYLMEDGIELE